MLNDAHVKIAACGRRWGKTESCAVDVVLYALSHPHSVQFIVAPTDDQTGIMFSFAVKLINMLPDISKRSRIVYAPYKLIEIGSSNGLLSPTTIAARTVGADGKGIRGHEADRVFADESAYIADDIMDAVVSPLLAKSNGQMIKMSTPSGRNHFYDDYQRGLDPLQSDFASFHFSSLDNRFLSRDYLDRQHATKPDRVWRVEYFAEFADAEGLVFRRVTEACTGAWADPVPGLQYAAGLDLARVNDFTVLSIIERQSKRLVYQDRFNKIDWPLQVMRICAACKRYGAALLMEVNNVGDVLVNDIRRGGVQVTEFVTTATTKPDLIDGLAAAFERSEIYLPTRSAITPEGHTCAVLVNELLSYAYERTPSGYVRMNAPEGQHDDCVMSLALAWRAASVPHESDSKRAPISPASALLSWGNRPRR
jgi:hypothetical protein